MKILSIVGARPNFMKIAPLSEQFARRGICHVLVHTGQHYDENMSRLFFDELGIPKPDRNLEVGSGTQAQQTAEIMKRLEPVLLEERPSLVIVVGDVTSTMAATITAVKLGIRVAHVESGLRSFDRSMPEEINRLLTDAIADYHFTTEESANQNLLREGISSAKVFFVGNTMIDTLLKHVQQASASQVLGSLGVSPKSYGVVTLHRPSNVDSPENLRNILEALSEIGKDIPLIFPVHPRTRKRINEFGLEHLVEEKALGWFSQLTGQTSCTDITDKADLTGVRGIILTDPLGYLDFLKLTKESRIVFTDSGGIQEETTVLGISCLTLRENTERPVTVTCGTNMLVGMDRNLIVTEGKKRLDTGCGEWSVPPLWDGRAAERVVDIICSW